MRGDGENQPAFLDGGGEMGALIRACDWSRHPLGPPETWPQALRTTVRLMLNTGHPIYIFGGPELYCFYNDAYRLSIGPERHPGSLGRPGREVWAEIWDIIGPQIEQVLAGRGATWHENALVPITRHGRREEVYWTYSYGPIDDDTSPNNVGGVLVVCTETTEVIRNRDRLRASEERFRALVTATSDVVYRMSADWKEMRQLDGRGFLADTDSPRIAWQDEYLLPEDQPQILRAIREAINSKGVFQLEHRVRRADGSIGWTFSRAVPSLDEDGEIVEWFGAASDITEARQARETLHLNEDRLRLAAEAARIGTWDFNPRTGTLRWDARCKELFGLPPDAEVTYEGTFLAGLHPADRERADVAVQAALSTAGVGAFDIEYRTIGLADGVERWVAATGNAHFENGEAVRFIGTVRDISERKRAERRLAIVNKTGAAVAAELDLDKIVQMITDAGVELSGAQFGAFFYNVINAAGESYMLYSLSGVPREAFSKFPMPRNTAVFEPTFSGNGVVISDDITRDERYGKNAPRKGMPEGHLPVRSYLAVPVIALSGEVHGGLFFGHSEIGMFSKEHETLMLGLAGQAATAIDNARLFRELQTLNSTLEQRVSEEVLERTRAEEQLRQSQKMEAIGQLTGGIAHDFNNMLAVVIGGMNILQRRLARGDTDVGKYIDAAIEGATRATALTQRLLAFSRQQPLDPKTIDANKLVGSMTDLLARTLGEQIQVETVMLSGLWRTFADPLQLESSILNLAVNARDAMPEGGKLTIETANAAVDDKFAQEYGVAAGQYVLIAVTDTGAGMTREIAEKAFDPFFTTKEVGKGTGLGLSQVFGFVRQSGGHVKLYSEPGVGTTVKIYLPRYHGAETTGARTRAEVGPALGSKHELVLVVEDDDRVRAYSIDALTELGYKVIAAPGAAEALRMIEAGARPNLLFTDVVMPQMNGRQLASRAQELLPGLKVLFTTGYTRNAVVHNGVLDPGTAYLQKPFTVDQLAEKIRSVLDS